MLKLIFAKMVRKICIVLILVALGFTGVVKSQEAPDANKILYIGSNQCRATSTDGRFLYDLNSIDRDQKLNLNTKLFEI
jgi:hypothetical protein